MRRVIGAAILLLSLALLIHDAASGRFSIFRTTFDVRYLNDQLFGAIEQGSVERVEVALRKGAHTAPLPFPLHCREAT